MLIPPKVLFAKSSAPRSAGHLPARSQVAPQDQWNLRKIFPSDAAWRKAFTSWRGETDRYAQFRGKLGTLDGLEAFLTFDSDFDRQSEKLLLYAYLKSVEDVANPLYQGMKDEISTALAAAAQAASFARPEILSAPKRIIALTAEMGQTPSKAFRLLTDADFTFGTVKDENGIEKPLTHETFSLFLHSPDRSVRKKAFEIFYKTFDGHKNSLAALLEGSVRGAFEGPGLPHG